MGYSNGAESNGMISTRMKHDSVTTVCLYTVIEA